MLLSKVIKVLHSALVTILYLLSLGPKGGAGELGDVP
jgi:hypothetical protein